MNMPWLTNNPLAPIPLQRVGIRRKVFLINFLLLIVLMLLISAFNRYQVRHAIEQEQHRQLLQAKSQFVASLAKDLDYLSKMARDWSEWEDAASFLAGKNSDFVSSNLGDSTLSTLNLHYLAYYSLDRKPIAILNNLRGIQDAVLEDSIARILKMDLFENSSHGHLVFGEQVFRYSWKPVKKSANQTEKSVGRLLFVKEINDDELKESSKDGYWEVAKGKCANNLDSLRCQSIEIEAVNGAFAHVSISMQPNLQELSRTLEFSQTFGLLLLALLFAILVWWFIERNLLKRILGLSQDVERIIRGDQDATVNCEHNDEIGLLATRIEQMVQESRSSHNDLANALTKMEEAQRVRNTFFALMSHDLRTPLNGVIGMSSILLRNDPRPAQREGLEMVQGAAEALLSSLNDILDFAKIGQERMELSQDIVSLENCLESTLRILSIEAHRKKLIITLQMDADLPATVILDEQRFRQIINNLTSNAIKFTSEGEVIVQIRTMEKHDENYVFHVSVKDQGCGIPVSRQEEIFRPFVHGNESVASQAGGVGLGLTIAAEIARSMETTIQLNSKEGEGSEFHFTLNVRVPNNVKEICPAKSSQGDSSVEISVLTYSTILAGDIQDKLLRQGFRSQRFTNWDSLIHDVESRRRKVWVVDALCLPGERLSAFKERADLLQGISLILLTDSSRIYDPEDAQELGIVSVLRKPFAPSSLLELVRNEMRTSLDVYLWTSSPFLSLLTQGVLGKRGHRVVSLDSLESTAKTGVFLLDSDDLDAEHIGNIASMIQKGGQVIVLGKCAAEVRLPKGVVALHKPVESSALIDAIEHVQSNTVREYGEEIGIYIG